MKNDFNHYLEGYRNFRKKYAACDKSVMHSLSTKGQKPKVMIISCCDSRVDPSIILQTEPGELFIVRNVANIVPPYQTDSSYHGTSAALEFGICILNIEHIILLGHSQCGGIQAFLNNEDTHKSDFIKPWVSILKEGKLSCKDTDECAKKALNISYNNCLTFPWIKTRRDKGNLKIHQWFFEIKKGLIYSFREGEFSPIKEFDLSQNL